MSRNVEFPIPEHLANATRNDLPRDVLSYADGLVLQAREILDRHGVALEDLKKPEVRERIPAEDIRRLLELSAKNAAARRGEVDATMRREILGWFDKRESRANDLLMRAEISIPMDSYHVNFLSACYLRSGMTDEARALVTVHPDKSSLSTHAAIDHADGLYFLPSDSEAAARCLIGAAKAEMKVDLGSGDGSNVEAYLLDMVRVLPNDKFFETLDSAFVTPMPRGAYVYRVFAHEAERRGLALPLGFEERSRRADAMERVRSQDQVDAFLALARADASYEKDPDEALRRSFVALREIPSRDERLFFVPRVVETAAMILDDDRAAAFIDLLSSLGDREASADSEAELVVSTLLENSFRKKALFGAVIGFARAGKFDRAEERLSEYAAAFDLDDPEFLVVAVRFLSELLGRGEIGRAEGWYAVGLGGIASGSRLLVETEKEFFVARARRGDDILSHVQIRLPDARKKSRPRDVLKPFDMAAIEYAIATIEYARRAKKRISEYGSKR